MRILLSVLAHVHVYLWWQLRIDPSGRVTPTLKLLACVTATVLGFFTVTGTLSNVLLGDPALAASPPSSRASKADDRADETTASRNRTPPSTATTAGVPGSLLGVYRDAATTCNMSWETLAAVGWVESHHGELVAPGVKGGTNFAGARGPMQFLSATWQAYGTDANGDGRADVYDPIDAIHGASRYLCANGARDDERLRDALFTYNRSTDYVNEVLAVAAGYQKTTYVYPLPVDSVEVAELARPHHDYPAADVTVAAGTTLFAAHGGHVVDTTDDGRCGRGVIIDGADGARYTYCHMTRVDVERSDKVSAGDEIGTSGGTVGSRGSGSSTTPHLHLQVEVSGRLVCPQAALVAWSRGDTVDISKAPTTGCSY